MATLIPTPGTAYISITPALQAFYAARGMWLNGPCSTLASMLGPRCPWPSPYGTQFFVSRTQLAALMQDLVQHGPLGLTGKQIGQTLRRMREAAERAGDHLPPHAPACRTHPAGKTQPFDPLVCPPPGSKARQAFEWHVMESLHAVIARSQESTY